MGCALGDRPRRAAERAREATGGEWSECPKWHCCRRSRERERTERRGENGEERRGESHWACNLCRRGGQRSRTSPDSEIDSCARICRYVRTAQSRPISRYQTREREQTNSRHETESRVEREMTRQLASPVSLRPFSCGTLISRRHFHLFRS